MRQVMRSVVLVLLALAGVASETTTLRDQVLAWLETSVAKRSVIDVPWMGNLVVEVVAVDRAAATMTTRVDRSVLSVPLVHVDDRQLLEVLVAASTQRIDDPVSAMIFAAAMAMTVDDQPRALAQVEAASRLVADAEERFIARLLDI